MPRSAATAARPWPRCAPSRGSTPPRRRPAAARWRSGHGLGDEYARATHIDTDRLTHPAHDAGDAIHGDLNAVRDAQRWHRARPGPSEFRARARAKPCARCCRRVRRPRRPRAAGSGSAPGPATFVTRMSPGPTRESSHSQFTTHARPEPQPTPAGWPLRRGWRSQISSGHRRRRRHAAGGLQQLEPALVHRPFDFHRHAHDVLDLAQQPSEFDRLRLARDTVRRTARAAPSWSPVCMQPTRWSLRPSAVSRSVPSRLSTMRSGTTSPCAIAEPSPQVALMTMSPSARAGSSRRRTRAPTPAAGPARPSPFRPGSHRGSPCSAARAWPTAPPSRSAPR